MRAVFDSLRKTGAALARPGRGLARLRWLALAVAVAGLAACSASTEGTPDAFADDQPAGTLYNEGLAYLNAGKLTRCGQELRRGRPPASLFGIRPQGADHVDLRQLQARQVRQTRSRPAKRYLSLYPGSPDAAYAQYLIGSVLLPAIPDVTRDQDMTRKALAALRGDRQQLSRLGIRRRRARTRSSSRATSSPARKCRSAATISSSASTWRRSTASRSVVTQYQTTRHVEEALERLAEANMALGLTRRGADGGGDPRAQFPGQPVVQGRLQAPADRRSRAAREQGVVD